MADTLLNIQFQEACATDMCPFCALTLSRTRRYLSRLLYEYATAPDIHMRFARAFGLCEWHGRMLVEVTEEERSDGLAAAILYETVLNQLLTTLDEIAPPQPHRRAVGRHKPSSRLLHSQETCPLCDFETRADTDLIRTFVDELEASGLGNPLMQSYLRSARACRPHLSMLLSECRNRQTLKMPELVEGLVRDYRAALRALADTLSAFIAKHDYTRQSELPEAERESWIRAVELCGGGRHGPYRHSGTRHTPADNERRQQ